MCTKNSTYGVKQSDKLPLFKQNQQKKALRTNLTFPWNQLCKIAVNKTVKIKNIFKKKEENCIKKPVENKIINKKKI